VMYDESSTVPILLQLFFVLVTITHLTDALTSVSRVEATTKPSPHIHTLLKDLEQSLPTTRTVHSLLFDSDEKAIKVLDTCLRVYHSFPRLSSNISKNLAFPDNVRSLIDQQVPTPPVIGSDRHFFDVQVWDDALQELFIVARTIEVKGCEDHSLICDIANSILASARILLASKEDIDALEDMLQTKVGKESFLRVRSEAVNAVKQRRRLDSSIDSVTDAAVASEDDLIINALYECTIKQLGPSILSEYGFPTSKLGLRSLIGATRATGSQRAAATMDRIWHAAEEEGPLIFAGNAPVTKSDKTLIVAFSSLGWNGFIRPEWGATLRTAQANDNDGRLSSSPLVIVHALDTSQSWFSSSPISGEWDEGSWWDTTLKELCCEYGRVCFIGESMGASAALRFSRHCTPDGSVIAFVPQIHLQDFPQYTRVDFTPERKQSLCTEIQKACKETKAQVTIHVGRDEDDLYQLNYIPEVVEAHLAVGKDVDVPLPRDGNQESLVVGNNKLRVLKHDVEGHALGSGLKSNGILTKTIVTELFNSNTWSDSEEPSVRRGEEQLCC